jgi:hypothetical protein
MLEHLYEPFLYINHHNHGNSVTFLTYYLSSLVEQEYVFMDKTHKNDSFCELSITVAPAILNETFEEK